MTQFENHDVSHQFWFLSGKYSNDRKVVQISKHGNFYNGFAFFVGPGRAHMEPYGAIWDRI